MTDTGPRPYPPPAPDGRPHARQPQPGDLPPAVWRRLLLPGAQHDRHDLLPRRGGQCPEPPRRARRWCRGDRRWAPSPRRPLPPPPARRGQPRTGTRGGHGLPFTPIAPVAVTVDDVTVPSWLRAGTRSSAGATRSWRARRPSTPRTSRRRPRRGSSATTATTSTSSRPTGSGTRALLVANHEYTNENIMFPPGTDAELRDPHGLGRARPVRRRARARRTAATRGTTSRAPASTAGSPSTPRSASTARRPAPTCSRPPRTRTGAPGPRHDEQLRRRHDAVGHGAVGRGELQPVLPRHRHRPAREARTA